jgi:hypothetical protein
MAGSQSDSVVAPHRGPIAIARDAPRTQANARPYTTSRSRAQFSSEPTGSFRRAGQPPRWPVASLAVLTTALVLAGGLAPRRASRRPRPRLTARQHQDRLLDGAAAPTRQPHHPAGSPITLPAATASRGCAAIRAEWRTTRRSGAQCGSMLAEGTPPHHLQQRHPQVKPARSPCAHNIPLEQPGMADHWPSCWYLEDPTLKYPQ